VKEVLLVMGGGAAGALARYLCNLAAVRLLGTNLWATLAVNVLGSFALGFLLAFLAARAPSQAWLYLVAGVGFLGSFTTYSTVMADTVALTQNGAWQVASLNLGASLVLGLAAAGLGFWLGRLV